MRGHKHRLLTPQRSPRERVAELFLLLIVVTSCALFYVWTRTEAIELSYRVLEAARLEKNLISQNKKLKYEFARLLSPQRLELIAKRELHLVDPKSDQIVYMKSWSSSP